MYGFSQTGYWLYFLTDPSDFTVKDSHSEDLYDMELTTSLQRARVHPLLQVQSTIIIIIIDV